MENDVTLIEYRDQLEARKWRCVGIDPRLASEHWSLLGIVNDRLMMGSLSVAYDDVVNAQFNFDYAANLLGIIERTLERKAQQGVQSATV